MATHSEFLAALVDALGADRVQVGDAVPARHHTDWSGTPPVPPLALVRPRSTEEVSALLRLCHAHRVPVVLEARGSTHAWVREGLQAGAQVVVYPPTALADGARVRVRAP